MTVTAAAPGNELAERLARSNADDALRWCAAGGRVSDRHDLETLVARSVPPEVPIHLFERIRQRNEQSAVDPARVEALASSARCAISARVWELSLTLARVLAASRPRARRRSKAAAAGAAR
jgi:hypothetical protein